MLLLTVGINQDIMYEKNTIHVEKLFENFIPEVHKNYLMIC